jgi:sec-independent protein translocase protein TatC
MKIIDHIKELEKTSKKIIIFTGIILLINMIFSRKLIKIYIDYFEIMVYAFNPLEELKTLMLISIALTLILSSPYIIWKLYKFIKPAYKMNKPIKNIIFVTILAIIMYIIGSTISTKYLLKNLNKIILFENMWSLTSILNISIMLGTSLAIAVFIAYIIPILVKIELIEKKSLKKSRKYVFLILFILSSFVTPTDILSTLMVFIPFYISFEIGNLISKIHGGKKNVRNTRNRNYCNISNNVVRST